VVHKRVLNSSKAREDANQIKAKGVIAEFFRKKLRGKFRASRTRGGISAKIFLTCSATLYFGRLRCISECLWILGVVDEMPHVAENVLRSRNPHA
jgi:hypothetical protein